ncbi:hypothetical protein ABZP36_030994 [Zizania latifolia]
MMVWCIMHALGVGHEHVLQRSLASVDKFKSDLLTVFTKMHVADTGTATYSDKFLHDICVNFILAGRDTLSMALAWFFWLLDKNPVIEANILKDIKGIVVAWRRSSSPPLA